VRIRIFFFHAFIGLRTYVLPVSVVDRRAAFSLKNGQDAQALNKKFQTLTPNSPCTSGEEACVNNQLAQCVGNKFGLTPCSATLQCVAVPLVNKPGTRCASSRDSLLLPLTERCGHSVICDTLQDAQSRIAATGAQGGLTGPGKRDLESR
jgi:hypothetical protein